MSQLGGGEELEALYEALLDHDTDELYERAPCGYLSTTADGTIIKANQTFLTLTGYERADLVGRRSFSQLLTPGGRIYYETHYDPLLKMQGSAREIALDIVRSDGSRVPVLVNSVVDRGADDGPSVIRTVVFDATERREYERELLRAKDRAEESERRAVLLAQTLQRTLIPHSPPDVPGLDIGAAYRPAGDGSEVGGDFYDIFEVAADDWVVAIGDVRGKGAEAAVVTSLVRYTIRAAAVRQGPPSRTLATVNDVLNRDGTDRFCTVAAVRLRRVDGRWRATVCSAGHPLPLLSRAGGRPMSMGRAGQLLGVLDDVRLHDVDVELSPGDAFVLYTDGVTEGRRGDDFYGDRRLLEAIEAHAGAAEDLANWIVEDVLAFQSGSARDDIAVVAVRVPDISPPEVGGMHASG